MQNVTYEELNNLWRIFSSTYAKNPSFSIKWLLNG